MLTSQEHSCCWRIAALLTSSATVADQETSPAVAAKIRDWMKGVMRDTGMSVTEWAHTAGVARTTIARPLKDDYAFVTSSRTLAKLAEAAEVPPPPFIVASPAANRSRQQPVQLLPIRFRVQAGGWLQANVYASQAYGEAATAGDPRIPPSAQWLEEVVGESVNRRVKPGELVHVVDPVAVGYSPREGDTVIIERTRYQGREIERSIKVVRAGPNGWEFWGDSDDEQYNRPLRIDEFPDSEVRIAGWVRRAIRDL